MLINLPIHGHELFLAVYPPTILDSERSGCTCEHPHCVDDGMHKDKYE